MTSRIPIQPEEQVATELALHDLRQTMRGLRWKRNLAQRDVYGLNQSLVAELENGVRWNPTVLTLVRWVTPFNGQLRINVTFPMGD